jgi:hypothetical protein
MKQKLRIITAALPVFFIAGLQAQQSVTSGGGDGSGSGGTINFSVGQIAYRSVSGSTSSISQGVQQAYDFTDVGIGVNTNVNLYLAAYPNPVLSQLHLRVTDPALTKPFYSLYDQAGKLLRQDEVRSDDTTIEMQELANAVYFLKVTDKGETIKTFQIIKHN